MNTAQSYWAESIRDNVKLVRRYEEYLLANIVNARKSGLSWLQIGRQLGVSKQAAAQKYGPLVDEIMKASNLVFSDSGSYTIIKR